MRLAEYLVHYRRLSISCASWWRHVLVTFFLLVWLCLFFCLKGSKQSEIDGSVVVVVVVVVVVIQQLLDKKV